MSEPPPLPAAPGSPALPARLKRRREFLRVASRGRRAARPGVVVQAMAREAGDDEPVRLGFTVTKKVGNAVVRNRARRRLKEAARQALPGGPAGMLRGWDLVLIGREATGTRDFALLVADLRGALRQLGVGNVAPEPVPPPPRSEPTASRAPHPAQRRGKASAGGDRETARSPRGESAASRALRPAAEAGVP